MQLTQKIKIKPTKQQKQVLWILSQNGLWTAYEQFVRNLRQTGVPIGAYSKEANSSSPLANFKYM